MLSVLVYSLPMWLGLYLLARSSGKAEVRLTGLGLVCYALGLALDILSGYAASNADALLLARLRWPLWFAPALCWFGAAVHLLPDESRWQARLSPLILYGLPVFIALLFGVSLGTDWAIQAETDAPGPAYFFMGGASILLTLGAVIFTMRASERQRKPLLIVALFLFLSTGLLILPLDWLPRGVVLLAIGLDLAVLGLLIAFLDAFAEGENFLPDFTRSLTVSAFGALLYGGQAVIVLSVIGPSLPLVGLLLALITTAILVQVFYDEIQILLDRLVFSHLPHVRRARADLRAAANSLPRLNTAFHFSALDDDEFARLTRRALGNLGDLGRLSASPLTYLPAVEERLCARGETVSTLERAAELKALLTECILRLKPRGKAEFGTTDEWRYYNALYFPYVIGLKPYSLTHSVDTLDATSQTALEWLRASVPERTLHNWQNAAARLIAQELREKTGYLAVNGSEIR
jgi:hypothetical protein